MRSRQSLPTALVFVALLSGAARGDGGAPFSEGFEDTKLPSRGWYDGNGRFTLSDDATGGKHSLQYHFEKGKLLPSDSAGVRRPVEPTESVYLRFDLKLSPDWSWTNRPYGPHLFQFMTTENDRYHGPAASHLTVYVEPVNGKLRLATQDIQNKDAPHGLTQGPLRGGYNGQFFDSEDVHFDDGKWHRVEATFKLNSLDLPNDRPNADGELRGWVDGKLVIERTDVVFRSTDFPRMKFNQFLMLPYFHHGVPHDQTLWLDEMVVGTERPSPPAAGGPGEFPGAVSRWEGFERHDFEVDGAKAIVVVPDNPLPGRPWAWRAEFFGAFAGADVALLKAGWHLAHLGVPDLFGSPAAVARWEQFHSRLVSEHGLSPRPGVIGLSRGALYGLSWAAAHPDRTLALYLDNGVCDFRSWPGGRPKGLGKGAGSPDEWAKLLKAFGFKDDAEAVASEANPIRRLGPIAAAKVPILLVYGDSDRVVPHLENSAALFDQYRALGGPIERVVKPGQDHHPHGLTDPQPVVDFFEKARRATLPNDAP